MTVPTETVQATETVPSARPARRITARTIQIGLGIIWLADGLFQLQPKMFGTAFANGVILPSAQGQPAIISSVITHTAHLMAAQPVLTDLVFAGIQLLIGAGLLIRETVKPALVLSFVWALGVWSLGEGFGGLFNGTAMPLTGAPGAALLYLAIGLLVWPRRVPRDAHGPAAAEGPLGEGGGTALWALVWCGFGLLWLLPASSNSGALSGALKSAAAGEPGWLAHLQLSVAHSIGSGGGSVALVAASPLLLRRGRADSLPAQCNLPHRRGGHGPRLLGVGAGVRAGLHRHGDRPGHGAAARPVGAGGVSSGRARGSGSGRAGPRARAGFIGLHHPGGLAGLMILEDFGRP
jgi:hypothetical protein